MVSGPGVYTGSQVVGTPGSSSDNREGTGVASLTPATPNATSAEAAVPQTDTQQPAADTTGNQASSDQIEKKTSESRLLTKLTASSSQREKDTGLIHAISSLKSQIRQQHKLINALLEGTNSLNLVKEKSKSPHVREAIDVVIDAAEAIQANRHILHGAFYKAEKAATRASTQQKPIPPPHEWDAERHVKQDAILKVCEELKTSVAKQQEDINQLKRTQTPTLTYAQRAEPQASTSQTTQPDREPATADTRNPKDFPAPRWTKAERKKDNSKDKTRKGGANARGKPSRPLPDSIAVKPENGECNHDILRAIKENVDLESIGACVSSITESRNGEILFRQGSGDTKKTELMEELKTRLGSRAAIRSLTKYDDVSILNLDSVTTEADVKASIKSALGLASDDLTIKVKNIWQSFGGTQRAYVRLRSSDAIQLAKARHVKIGWINARFKLKDTAPRCFRYLGYGHTRHTCEGPDRSNACSLCVSTGHKASDCKSPPKCAACLDRKEASDHYPGSGKCSAYQAAKAKKKSTANTGSRDADEESDAKSAKRDLVRAIKKAKEAAWKNLCDQVQNDPWGLPYKLIIGKLTRPPPIPELNSPGRLQRIVDSLFPQHPIRSDSEVLPVTDNDGDIPLIDKAELISTARSLKNNIPPGTGLHPE
ncbi:hypothetical protein QTP88_020950 [Uroleucon formosanum]